jgi:hypothetical protein
MPTKRRFMLFLIVLIVMLLIKYAVGQEAAEPTVGWDPVSCWDCRDDEALAFGLAAIIGGIFWGIIAGFGRAWNRHVAAREGAYFTGDLVLLRIRA